MRHAGLPIELERRRRLALRRSLEGYGTSEVARFLEVDPSSVRRWKRAYRRGGSHALDAHPADGRPPKLSRTQEKIVLRWLQNSALDFGFSTDLWTCQRIQQVIQEEFEVHFNDHYLAEWLRRRGTSPQMPQRVPRGRDWDAIKEWRLREWPRIQKMQEKSGFHIAFIDESGVLLQPLVRRSWSPKGHPPKLLQAPGHRDKVSIAAAVVISPNDYSLSLFFKTLLNDYFDGEYSAYFLEALLQSMTGRMIAIWDRGNIHKGDPHRQIQRAFGDRLLVMDLPSYSPMLNPVEPLWSWLKYGRLCNYAPSDSQQLETTVRGELENCSKNQQLLKSFFYASELPFRRVLLS